MTTAIAPDDALARWQRPHPDFASGHDSRSSENGLLNLFYGSLERASRYEWLNAGRTLVDKTYLRILWTSCELPPQAATFDQLASDLDSFIRQQLTPRWDQIDELDHNQRHQLAIELVDCAAMDLFRGNPDWQAASMLLFFLCPQLPVFPWHPSLQGQTGAESGETPANYSDYHQRCRPLLALKLPHCTEPPKASLGDERQCKAVNQLLARSDWWARRSLINI